MFFSFPVISDFFYLKLKILVPWGLTLILLFTTTPTFANSVDPDQMASKEAIWSGSTLFVIQFVNLNENIIWCNLIGW